MGLSLCIQTLSQFPSTGGLNDAWDAAFKCAKMQNCHAQISCENVNVDIFSFHFKIMTKSARVNVWWRANVP